LFELLKFIINFRVSEFVPEIENERGVDLLDVLNFESNLFSEIRFIFFVELKGLVGSELVIEVVFGGHFEETH
jgi:hypothetical protein